MSRNEPSLGAPNAFASARLGPVTLRNRIVKAATFEGMTPEHVVTDGLIDFHRRIARGGAGMTRVAFCVVSPEGCGTPNEMILGDRVHCNKCVPTIYRGTHCVLEPREAAGEA